MKVTTELKNLIKRSFDEKRKKVKAEFTEAIMNVYNAKKDEVENSEEFKAYVTASQELYKMLKKHDPDSDPRSECPYWVNFRSLDKVKVKDFICDGVQYYINRNSEVNKKLNEQITALDLAQESLLIKLTYEKNLDVVKEMLAEYDIVI